LWQDYWSAFNHAVFVLAMSGLGIEVFFYRYRKFPSACPHELGKLKLESKGVFFLAEIIVN